MSLARILLLADSHLGFDLPARPRSDRRRRGHDFLANYAAALAPAFAGEVDLVVHAGDVFNRSHVLESVAYQALDPLRRIAELGVPVFIVPGNHERARIPHARFASHPNVHVFDRPRTFSVDVRNTRVALTGFPYEREGVRTRFARLLDDTRWSDESADVRLLCIHHCVEGAKVGTGTGATEFTFTSAADVIRVRDVPREFAAVLTGHVHRRQVLTSDLQGRALRTPVIYPGSIERTSFAESEETKGYVLVDVVDSTHVEWTFRDLPARPMVRRELSVDTMSAASLDAAIRAIIAAAPSDAVVSIRVDGELSEDHRRAITASRIRSIAPPTMNVDVRSTEWIIDRSRSPNVDSETPGLQLPLIGV